MLDGWFEFTLTESLLFIIAGVLVGKPTGQPGISRLYDEFTDQDIAAIFGVLIGAPGGISLLLMFIEFGRAQT